MAPNKAVVGGASADRRYFFFEEVAHLASVGLSELIHLAAHGCFPAYVLADNWDALAFIRNDETGNWVQASPSMPCGVSGPLRLYPSDLQRLEGNPAAIITKLMGDTAGYDEHEPEEDWQYRLVGDGVSLDVSKLVMMANDLQTLNGVIAPAKRVADSDRPLGTRERVTLLKIIAAIATDAHLDLSHITKLSVSLSASTESLGTPVSPKAIENHLKAALAIVDIPKKSEANK